MKWVNDIGNIGVRKGHLPWEVHLIRKLNITSLFGIFNILLGAGIFIMIGYMDTWKEMLVCLLMAPAVFWLNSRYGYVAASYMFSVMGYAVFFILSARTGFDSFSFLYYFPFLFGLTQMLARREVFRHLLIQLFICMVTILGLVYCMHEGYFISEDIVKWIPSLRIANIIIVFFTSLVFILIISLEAAKQEKELQSMIQQKQILLAELYHRVKNNLNLVTSLLNLKKSTITSEDGIRALEECRDLVFSMAMIHTKVYNSGNMEEIRFDEYIKDLSGELVSTLSAGKETQLSIDTADTVISVKQAIPCGLIINELVTNSFKHADVKGVPLMLQLTMSEETEKVKLEYRDNGKGLGEHDRKKNTLGLELIDSLVHQLDGKMEFGKGPGFCLRMEFRKEGN